RHRVEAAVLRVVHEDQRVANAELRAQAVERAIEKGIELAHARDALRARAHRRKEVAARRPRREDLARNALDLLDVVEIRSLQPEDAAHAGVRGDARELRLHALEERPRGLGAAVA